MDYVILDRRVSTIMINSAVAYIAAALTSVVLFVSGVSLASDSDDVSVLGEAGAPTTVPPAETAESTTTSAPVLVVVPALGGTTALEARRLLREAGFEMTSSAVDAVVDYAIDVVVASDPPEGTALFLGDTVNIVMGRRPSANLVDRSIPIAWDEIDSIDTVDETVGRCSVGRQSDSLLTLDFADCGGPHDFQYLARIDLVESFSTRDEAASALWAACAEAFGAFVGAPFGGSGLDLQLVLDWESGVAGANGQCLIQPRLWGQQIVGDAAGSLW